MTVVTAEVRSPSLTRMSASKGRYMSMRLPNLMTPHCSPRFTRRYETWNKAVDAKAKYEAGKWNEDDIIGKAKDTGYWSVWFTVFTGIDSILSRLISDFVGTCTSCFDAANHYKPIPRNPENAVDPI